MELIGVAEDRPHTIAVMHITEVLFNGRLEVEGLVRRRAPNAMEREDQFVPVSTHAHHRGRISLKLHGGNWDDPVEVYFTQRGFRLGTGVEQLRVSYTKHLSDRMKLQLRSSFAYDDHDVQLRGILSFEVSPRTTLNFTAGSDIHLLSTPAAYDGPFLNEPRSEGVLFYVEHLF